MDAKGLQIDSDTFSCSICLDLLKDPVTIPCGHSYCMTCLDTHWTGEEDKKSYSCPQCRHLFPQRPALVKNPLLVILMEGLKKNGPPSAAVCPSASCGDVYCDLCSGRKVRAVKSCLQCLVSYCKEHVQPHYDVPALKKHKLVEPTDHLQGNLCPRHDEVMKMFCRTDQQCICYLCSVDQHKDHHTVTAAAERAEKQRELQVFQKNILLRLDHRQKDVDLLLHQVKSCDLSADTAVDLCDKSHKQLLALLQKRMSEIKRQVRAQRETEEQRVKELQDKVQQEITELKRKVTELDTLSHTEDHVTFLVNFASLSKISKTSISVKSQNVPPYQDMVTSAVSKLKSALQETSLTKPKVAPKTDAQTTAPPPQPSSKDLLTMLLPNLNQPQSTLLPPPPHQNSQKNKPKLKPASPPISFLSQPSTESSFRTLRDLQKYGRNLTWDSWSLNDRLELSHGNLRVTHTARAHRYLPHPARFTRLPQVVSRESLTGCRFWEVRATFHRGFAAAVAYRDVRRDGPTEDCGFGRNRGSWALECSPERSVFWHDGERTEIPTGASAVGVFLDHKAGVLSFYRMGYSFQHIHTVVTTFTQPLVAGLRLNDEGSVAELSRRKFY